MGKYSSLKKNLNNYQKIAICSHDAGGAEVISSMIKKIKKKYFFSLSGPAWNIFKKKIKKLKNTSLRLSIDNSQLLITSASIRSNIELKAIKYAKKKNKKTISVLDNWSRYKERFLLKNSLILPDELWALDNDAFNISKKFFPKIKIKIFKNFYLSQIKKIKNLKNKKILFVSNNYDDFYKKKNVDLRILRKYVKFLTNNKLINSDKILYIKPHPSEKNNKYKNLKLGNMGIKIIYNKELFQIMRHFGVVAGNQSMALVAAKLSGLRTICIKRNKKEINTIPERYIDQYI